MTKTVKINLYFSFLCAQRKIVLRADVLPSPLHQPSPFFPSSFCFTNIKASHLLLCHMSSFLGATILTGADTCKQLFPPLSVKCTHTRRTRKTTTPEYDLNVIIVRGLYLFYSTCWNCQPHLSKWMASIALSLFTAVSPERPSLDSTQ